MAASNHLPPAEFDHQTNNFASWLQSSQRVSVNPNITIRDLRSAGAGRGIIATAPLAKDELLFSIPRSSVLTLETSDLNALLGKELRKLESPWLSLILVLIYETRPDSPWKPYMDILPREFDTLMYWTPEELSLLRGSAVLNKIGRDEAEEQFATVLWPIIQSRPDVFQATEAWGSKEAFLQAAHRMGSIIMSYSFDLDIVSEQSPIPTDEDDEEEEEGVCKAMVPLADMLNADADQNNCRLFQTPQFLEMRTIIPVPVGAELFNDYGPLPRSDLLRRYGYITPNYTPYDVVEVSAEAIISACDAESGKQDRLDYLLEEDVLDDAYDFDLSLEVPEEILVVMQTLLMTDDEFADYKRKGKVPRPKLVPVTDRLLRVLQNRLGDYETSIEEDEALLKNSEVMGRRRMAIEVRLGEKKILKGVLDEVVRQTDGKRGMGGGEPKVEDVKRPKLS
ncbi:SET domain-containing protein [Ascodesmis nigricans]|uniref:Ribosomal lysine N-methyltransferase 4 n=1 Tax=Ascodesmis nigricans TaxID=341454 RepID=A0A4S2N6C5_9PEZI|nr:SET domain-containing protein [Ascodesmis nigricans]